MAKRKKPLQLPESMNVLLVGGGGREHALAWKLRQSSRVKALYATHHDNPGISALAQPMDQPYSMREIYRTRQFCDRAGIDMVVVGPEQPLAEGIADELASDDRVVFGPGAKAAQLEADKAWSKKLLRAAAAPTAEGRAFTDAREARAYLKSREVPQVVKASGLAGGKGVIVPETMEEGLAAIDAIMVQKQFGDAGREIVIEERLKGPEASVLALVDGRTIMVFPPAQDHKRLGERDTGPNTGGMGAYSPTPVVDSKTMDAIEREILIPVVDALRREEIEYRGVLYAGLMLTAAGPKVLEFNVRFGDPECQTLLPRLKGDLAELCWHTATGTLEEADAEWDSRASCCVVVASEGYPGDSKKGQEITGVEEAETMDGVHVFYASARRNEGGALISGGGRVLNVVALGDTLTEAREKANAAASIIQFEGKVFRRDIGAKADARA